MGHEVNMVTSWREQNGRKSWFVTYEEGIRVHWLPVPYSNQMNYNQRILSFLKFAWGAAHKAASLPADVVFATSTPLTIILPGVYSARRQNVPMVFEVRDLWPEVPIAMGAIKNPILIKLAYVLERIAISSAASFVTLFDRAKVSLIEKGVDKKYIKVIPNGADLDLFSMGNGEKIRESLQCSSKTILILYAGTFGRVNGVNYIVDLANQLRTDKRFLFLLIGDGVEKNLVLNQAAKYNILDQNLFIKDCLPKREIVDYLAAADIAISTVIPLKILEGDSANKVFDGLAAGRLIAVNHGGQLKKLLVATGAGIQLSQNISVAAKQLQELAEHPERLAKAKLAARKLAEQHFSRDRLAEQLEHVLVEAVNNYSDS
jgi:glycosyltransferase involved in cell wall biosynthesis